MTEGPKPFEVTLSKSYDFPFVPLDKPKDPMDRGEEILLAFRTSFGLHTLRWEYTGGHAYLENEATAVQVPWKRLMAGRDFTIEMPYQGVDPEEKGTWEFRFVPESSLK